MIEIDIDEAKTRLLELVKKIEKGERITITNRGVPVAELVPSASRGQLQTAETIAAIRAMAKSNAISQSQFNEMRSRAR